MRAKSFLPLPSLVSHGQPARDLRRGRDSARAPSAWQRRLRGRRALLGRSSPLAARAAGGMSRASRPRRRRRGRPVALVSGAPPPPVPRDPMRAATAARARPPRPPPLRDEDRCSGGRGRPGRTSGAGARAVRSHETATNYVPEAAGPAETICLRGAEAGDCVRQDARRARAASARQGQAPRAF